MRGAGVSSIGDEEAVAGEEGGTEMSVGEVRDEREEVGEEC